MPSKKASDASDQQPVDNSSIESGPLMDAPDGTPLTDTPGGTPLTDTPDGTPLTDRPDSEALADAPLGDGSLLIDQDAIAAAFGQLDLSGESAGEALGDEPLAGATSRATAGAVAAPVRPVDQASIELLLDVPLQVSVELGRTRLTVSEILALRIGSVLELNKMANEPGDVLVNGALIARGEVVVVDEKFGVRIVEILPAAKRLATLA